MSKARAHTREAAETLAIQALSFLATDPDQLSRFLALSGIGPGSIRAAAAQPEFLAGVLAHLAQDDALLVRFAAEAGVEPGAIERARAVLSGLEPGRDVP
jgi:Protein of unknown function (DUF3572)